MATMNAADQQQRLEALISSISHPDLWRPVEEVEQVLTTGSIEGTGDPNTKDFLLVDVSGKEILDLGCNVGYYTYLALKRGAKHVVGEDIIPESLEIARILGEKHNCPGAEFREGSFFTRNGAQHEMVFFIDIIGNNSVREGRAVDQFDAAVRAVGKELIISVRPVFVPERHLAGLKGAPPLEQIWEELRETYGGEYCRGDHFYFLEWAHDRLGPGWKVNPLPDDENMAYSIRKQIFHIVRKDG
ncbi:methyltransferase domain-containing protein [Oceanidesulfovibrio marinus]|uniref:Methyltransferase domain-containing protein n=2 Tax=Oceanidesulfovibrio marinus TaxID=370038 RepID=A0ABX6ND65_9BACT|nr:methyltransferase domain-containing protein [Oceanidesulfovibrio marinus]